MRKLTKLLRTLLCGALVCMSLVAVLPVAAYADGVSDEVTKYARKLAQEEGISTASVQSVSRGNSSSGYSTNVTQAGKDRNLYVIELLNDQGYGNENSDMDFAIFWKTKNTAGQWNIYYTYTKDDGDKHLQWDTHCQDSHKSLAGQTSGESYWGLRGGKRDIMLIALPNTNSTTEFLGVYFHKTGYATKAAGKHAWSGTSIKVAWVESGSVASIGIDNQGQRYVNYSSDAKVTYVAYRNGLTQCDYKSSCGTKAMTSQDWGHALFKLDTVTDRSGANAQNSVYVVELVTGETGYTDKKANIVIRYNDSAGGGQKTLTIDPTITKGSNTSDYSKDYPLTTLSTLLTTSTVDEVSAFTSSLNSLSDRNMSRLSQIFTGATYDFVNRSKDQNGNWLTEDHRTTTLANTALRPYTSTALTFIAPQDLDIQRIELTLEEASNTLVLQSLRVVELTESPGTNYFNGNFSLERVKKWKGHVIAQSKSIASISGNSTFVWEGSSKSNGLERFASGTGPYLDNTGNSMGISVHFADVLGAGIESLTAHNTIEPNLPGLVGRAALTAYYLRDNYGIHLTNNYYWNLDPYFYDSLQLEVVYKDTLGCTRKVQVPFTTCYLIKALLDNNCDLSGGSREQWIAGILQQNETAGITLRLAQFKDLVSVKLTYDSNPSSMVSVDGSGNRLAWGHKNELPKVDCAADPISVESICVYIGANDRNFRTVYNSNHKACLLETSLVPTYYWQSGSERGQQLSGGSSLTTTLGGSGRNALQQGSPKVWSTKNKYLVQIISSDVQTAGTDDPINAVFTYTTTSGKQMSTSVLSLPTLMANFYGTNFRGVSETHMYSRHMRRNSAAEFIIEVEDVATFDSITLTLLGDNEYQFRAVRIYKLEDLGQRYATQWNEASYSDYNSDNAMNLYWKREFSTKKSLKVAEASQTVQLYKNANQKTIYFTTYDASGNATVPEVTEKTQDYMTTIPSTMTFEQTKQNLGLSIVKYTYLLDVKVADSEDSGSNNYFYFQLQFADGSSAVVLANQQLLSDSFRAGKVESFSIKTTQSYGELVSVRIICDHTSSTSDVFDKLNIEYINISLQDGSGVSKTWVVENVGWIDIAYTDEGASFEVDGVEISEDQALSNAQIVKEFPISRTVAALDLLFSITTDAESAYDASHTFNNALGKGDYQAVLNYIDTEGIEQSKTINLLDYIKSYNDSSRVMWMFRPNKTDRFLVSLTDVSSIQSLVITRVGGEGTWKISSVTVQQVSGISDSVHMTSMEEYWRPYADAEEVASSTNAVGVPYSLGPGATATVSFTENEIELITTENTVSTVISREPITRMESLNIYVFSGSVAGLDYKFTNNSPDLKVTTIYNNALGAPTQASFTLSTLGTINGETVMYAKGLPIDGITTLTSLRLSPMSTSIGLGGPVIRQVIVQRVRSGVVVGTYFFDCLNTDISVAPNISYAPSSYSVTQSMNQTVTFQPAIDQKLSLTPETYDIAVALRYTSTLDPTGAKAVYQTPYVYLTDVGIESIITGKNITVPFAVPYVDEIVGITVVSSGPEVTFDNAIIRNYSGREANGNMLLSTTGLDRSFAVGTIPSVVNSDGSPVMPAVFSFTTAPKEQVPGSGTSGKVTMIVHYTDDNGTPQSMAVQDILRFLPDGTYPDPGTTIDLPILLSNVVSIQSVQISAEDSWFINELSVKLTNTDGSTTQLSNSVNNWAKGLEPLTIELGENVTGNYIQGFGLTSLNLVSGATGASGDSKTLAIKAYAGESISLIPDIRAIGTPDMTWEWEPVASGSLAIQADNTAIFTVPSNITAGQVLYVRVFCGGNQQLEVKVSIEIIEPPVAEEPEPSEPIE